MSPLTAEQQMVVEDFHKHGFVVVFVGDGITLVAGWWVVRPDDREFRRIVRHPQALVGLHEELMIERREA